MSEADLTPMQQAMVAAWDRHTMAEFAEKSTDATMPTMTEQPFVTVVPTMMGGEGQEGVRLFYSRYFLTGLPEDVSGQLVARTVGHNRIVDEIVHGFTHDIEMPWILPGVPPTGKRVEVALIAVVEFEGDKVRGERIYWDQASVLAQIGLIDASSLPVTGAEATRKVLDPTSEPSNLLIERGATSLSNAV
jgi:carboxymethylenebutenolidase